MPALRLVEKPLGGDAAERPSREEVAALWALWSTVRVPDYEAQTLRRVIRERFQ